MTKRYFAPLLVLFVFLFSSACAPVREAPTPSPAAVSTPEPTLSPTPAPTPDDPVQAMLDAMTVEEKVGQLLVVGVEGLTPGEDAAWALREAKVGGIILFGRNVADAQQLTSLTAALKSESTAVLPPLLCVDQEGGLVSRTPPEVAPLPSAYTYGQIADPEARHGACVRLGEALAASCTAFGFDLDFAPVADVWSNPENTVIGRRAFGSDADTVSACAVTVAQAIWDAGVVPVVKHFPGHGDTAVDSHQGLPVVERTLSELEARELVPFRHAAEAGLPCVMAAHILVPDLDPDRPASLSRPVVTGLLRESMGFDGVVFTDDLTMGAITHTYGVGEAAVLALEAGCDGILVCHGWPAQREAYDALVAAVASGRVTEARLDESVSRLLTLKQSLPPAEALDLATLNERIAQAQP